MGLSFPSFPSRGAIFPSPGPVPWPPTGGAERLGSMAWDLECEPPVCCVTLSKCLDLSGPWSCSVIWSREQFLPGLAPWVLFLLLGLNISEYLPSTGHRSAALNLFNLSWARSCGPSGGGSIPVGAVEGQRTEQGTEVCTVSGGRAPEEPGNRAWEGLRDFLGRQRKSWLQE